MFFIKRLSALALFLIVVATFSTAFVVKAFAAETSYIGGTSEEITCGPDSSMLTLDFSGFPGCVPYWEDPSTFSDDNFDISSIPDGQKLESVTANFYVNNTNNDNSIHYTPELDVTNDCIATGSAIEPTTTTWQEMTRTFDISSCNLTSSTKSIEKMKIIRNNTTGAGAIDYIELKVAYEPLIEYSLNDKTNNGNNLTNNAGVASDSANTAFPVSSKSAVFNGSSYLTAANSSSLSPSTTMTVEGWVYFTANPGTTPFTLASKGDINAGNAAYAVYGPGNGDVRAFIAETGSGAGDRDIYKWSGLGLTTNTWYHIAVTMDSSQPSASTFTLYLNGVNEGHGTSILSENATSIYTGSATTYIGASENVAGSGLSAFLNGYLDDVRIWNTLRNGGEINDYKDTELTGQESGLVAYYPFETVLPPSKSYYLNDLTSNGNILTNHGATSDVGNEAFTGSSWKTGFDGSSQYLTATSSSSLNPTATMTIESWVYFTADPGTTPFTIVGKGDFGGTTSQYSLYGPGNGEIRADISQNGDPSVRDIYKWAGLGLTTNTWYHVALTIDASQSSANTFELFINGVSKGHGTAIVNDNASAIYSGSDLLNVGSSVNLAGIGQSAYFGGYLDDLRIWNTVRTSIEINNNMNSRLTGSESGLVSYYPFDN